MKHKMMRILILSLLIAFSTNSDAGSAASSKCNFICLNSYPPSSEGSAFNRCFHAKACSGDAFSGAQFLPVNNTKPSGIDFDINVVNKIEFFNPYVALVLLNFHKDNWQPGLNLLHGYVAFSGYQTIQSVSRVIREGIQTLSDDKAKPTPKNRFINVKWTSFEKPNGKLLVTFLTKWIDEKAEQQNGFIAPTVEAEFSITPPYTLLNWKVVKTES